MPKLALEIQDLLLLATVLLPRLDDIAPVEKGMHTNGFRYKKCTHLTVGTGNVYLNPR